MNSLPIWGFVRYAENSMMYSGPMHLKANTLDGKYCLGWGTFIQQKILGPIFPISNGFIRLGTVLMITGCIYMPLSDGYGLASMSILGFMILTKNLGLNLLWRIKKK